MGGGDDGKLHATTTHANLKEEFEVNID